MTEKEKAAKGLCYDANSDQELIRERAACKEICHQLNRLPPSDTEGHKALIRELFGKTKGDFKVTPPFWCDYGYNIEIGRDFYVNHNCTILDGAKVTFGDHVFVAPNCGFYTAGHPEDEDLRNEGIEYAYPITIGNNVWIGAGVSVLPGVTVGDGSVIGAGSVVTHDIPEGVVAAGNPCKVLRKVKKMTKN